MANDPVDLDQHRDMAAQQATELRRERLQDHQADQIALQRRQEELERLLLAAPSANWPAAAAKAEHLIQLFAATPYGQSPRCKELIAHTLDDLRRLSKETEELHDEYSEKRAGLGSHSRTAWTANCVMDSPDPSMGISWTISLIYRQRATAETAMHAWAETTTAPALAIVQDPEDSTFEILESDEGGVITLRREQSCIESVWTANSGGIERLILANAYSIACCYGEIRQHEQTILVRHGTTDLAPALKQAIAHAHDVADWQATDAITRTFVDAISEGRDVDPWKRQHAVRVPDDVSKD